MPSLPSLSTHALVFNNGSCHRRLRREKDSLAHEMALMHEQQVQMKADLEDARSLILREQERTAKLEDSQEKSRQIENELQV